MVPIKLASFRNIRCSKLVVWGLAELTWPVLEKEPLYPPGSHGSLAFRILLVGHYRDNSTGSTGWQLLTISVSYDPAIPLFGIYPEKVKTLI